MNKLQNGLAGLILVGLVALGVGSYDAYRTHQAQGWPATSAEILSSDVERVFVGKRKGRHAWFPRVQYSYSVEGKSHFGSRIGLAEDSLFVKFKFTSGGYDRKNATVIVERYPTGAHVPVYYNPARPEEAALETDFPAITGYLLLIGGIAILAGVVGLVSSRR